MFDWINPVAAWLGFGGLGVAGLIAIAWFFPPFRKLAIEIGAVVIAVMAIYAKGASDARKRAKELQDAAERRAIESGKTDRTAAERDAASGVRDGFDTDDK